jgi:hypothetical protein
MTLFYPSLEAATAIQGVIALTTKTGNGQVRLGIQTAVTTIDVGANPLNPASAASFVSSTGPVNGLFFRFDPNTIPNGLISSGAFFRVGLLYSLSAAGVPSTLVANVTGLMWR